MKNLVKIKGDASFRKFFRKKKNNYSSIVVFAKKENKLKQTEITSPTFNLLNEYQINNIKINHYDLFRLKSVEELKSLDLFEDNKDTITFIEWPQIIKETPKNLIELSFNYEDNYEKRSVQIKGLDL